MTAAGFEAFGNATDAYGKARQALRVIEPYGTPTVEELAARPLDQRHGNGRQHASGLSGITRQFAQC